MKSPLLYLCFEDHFKPVIVTNLQRFGISTLLFEEMSLPLYINSFTKQQIFGFLKSEVIFRPKYECNSKTENVRKGRIHCVKKRKYWLPAFDPYPTLFGKAFLYRMFKPGDCEGEG